MFNDAYIWNLRISPFFQVALLFMLTGLIWLHKTLPNARYGRLIEIFSLIIMLQKKTSFKQMFCGQPFKNSQHQTKLLPITSFLVYKWSTLSCNRLMNEDFCKSKPPATKVLQHKIQCTHYMAMCNQHGLGQTIIYVTSAFFQWHAPIIYSSENERISTRILLALCSIPN